MSSISDYAWQERGRSSTVGIVFLILVDTGRVGNHWFTLNADQRIATVALGRLPEMAKVHRMNCMIKKY